MSHKRAAHRALAGRVANMKAQATTSKVKAMANTPKITNAPSQPMRRIASTTAAKSVPAVIHHSTANPAATAISLKTVLTRSLSLPALTRLRRGGFRADPSQSLVKPFAQADLGIELQ